MTEKLFTDILLEMQKAGPAKQDMIMYGGEQVWETFRQATIRQIYLKLLEENELKIEKSGHNIESLKAGIQSKDANTLEFTKDLIDNLINKSANVSETDSKTR